MRELKNGMKKLFTAIFCLFMNLIPGKKVTTNKNLKETERLCVEGSSNRTCINKMVQMCAVETQAVSGKYICYLKDVLEAFDSQKDSQKYLKKESRENFYADTG